MMTLVHIHTRGIFFMGKIIYLKGKCMHFWVSAIKGGGAN